MRAVKVGDNKFCGPAVLSIATGKSTDECARAISSVTGQYNVTSVSINDLIKAANRLRCRVEDTPFRGYSLFGVISNLAYEGSTGLFIAAVPKHVVSFEIISPTEIYFCDNHTKEPLPASSAARMMQKVDKILKIEQKPEPRLIKSNIALGQRTQFDVTRLSIWRNDYYEDPEDNRVTTIGEINFKSDSELKEIVARLKEMV